MDKIETEYWQQYNEQQDAASEIHNTRNPYLNTNATFDAILTLIRQQNTEPLKMTVENMGFTEVKIVIANKAAYLVYGKLNGHWCNTRGNTLQEVRTSMAKHIAQLA